MSEAETTMLRAGVVEDSSVERMGRADSVWVRAWRTRARALVSLWARRWERAIARDL